MYVCKWHKYPTLSFLFQSTNEKSSNPQQPGPTLLLLQGGRWHGDSGALAKQIEGRQIVSGNKMPNIRAEVKINRYAECWWPLFLDSEIVWSTCQPQWTKQNRQCLETREGRVRAAQSSENCWHRRWQLVKMLHHLVWTLYIMGTDAEVVPLDPNPNRI